MDAVEGEDVWGEVGGEEVTVLIRLMIILN